MSAKKTDSLHFALLNAKCPQCREGNMFKYKWWNISNFATHHKLCPICNLRYDREPGFFIGAMYISYAMIVVMVTIAWFVLYFIFKDPAFEIYIATIITLNIVLLPIFFRYSRVLYIYAFGGVKYNHHLIKIKNEKN